ncbi:UDP-N-acetylmuramoyl-L-alanine--D-glutamate ligase [Leptospira perolatii]|nr:UDP-N-acetylmuramoyl-L-alanine--D-glutamate ligase [Leptospira perolatii]
MNFPTSLLGQRVLVLGGGVSGLAALRLLREKQAVPLLSDAQKISEVSDLQIPENTPLADLLPLSLIIKSPGISWENPIVAQARQLAIPIVSEVEFARAYFSGRIVGVTGTDGKSTTTSLIRHLISKDFPGTEAGGNLGLAFSDFCLKPIPVAVLELSSYQLEDSSPLHLNVSVLLNLAPDHLERHKTLDNYFGAKAKIADAANPRHTFITNSRLYKERIQSLAWKCRILTFGREEDSSARILEDEQKIRTLTVEYDVSKFHLPGSHNLENLAASILAAEAMEADPKSIQAMLETFQGLPHRFQMAGKAADVQFINDSKSTNLHSMLAGMKGWKFRKSTCLILGGRTKKEDITPLKEFLKDKIGWVILFGEAKEEWGSELSQILGTHLILKDDLEESFSWLKNAVRSGLARLTHVVFSPACASFDQYKNFEERGNHFLNLVSTWAKEEP